MINSFLSVGSITRLLFTLNYPHTSPDDRPDIDFSKVTW